jgi:hypothetical protein
MAQAIERPSYFEGQILAARDLTSAVDYARGQRQRHNRLLHRWGIASGLALEKTDARTSAGVAFVEITVSAGVAVDGAGREVVLGDARRLAPADFQRSNVQVQDTEAWYPVFVRWVETRGAAATTAGACGGAGAGQPTRLTEGAEVVFGRPGSAADLDTQGIPDLGADAGSTAPWNVLVGFVQWSPDAESFRDAKDGADGVARRAIGVRAEVVESPSDRITVLTRPESEPGATLARLDQEEFSIGLQDGSGGMTKLFSVNRKGEVTAGGKPLGGGVRVESGLVSDGMRIPLPANVTEEAVAGGKVSLHIQVSAIVPEPLPNEVAIVRACFVDDARRVHCRVDHVKAPLAITPVPAMCSYTIIAFANEGGS